MRTVVVLLVVFAAALASAGDTTEIDTHADGEQALRLALAAQESQTSGKVIQIT